VNDPLRRQIPGAGEHCLSRGKTVWKSSVSNLPALFEEALSRFSMNCPIDTAAAQETAVCRIDDNADGQLGNIADKDAQSSTCIFL
jgi:hypothetical protein